MAAGEGIPAGTVVLEPGAEPQTLDVEVNRTRLASDLSAGKVSGTEGAVINSVDVQPGDYDDQVKMMVDLDDATRHLARVRYKRGEYWELEIVFYR